MSIPFCKVTAAFEGLKEDLSARKEPSSILVSQLDGIEFSESVLLVSPRDCLVVVEEYQRVRMW